MNHLKRDTQKGFTIVELVVVIIILGILAATALPRFLDVSEDAHIAAVDSVEGALSTGL
ncbi:MAG: prepilin-type N-terminal cleavage/methylation domain-containing protein, partial [Pseudomonadales bacterium]|nr:prepilin-type N-terminal cleavage/methylation domain-containing protein [Pseudomonadales bacterium]